MVSYLATAMLAISVLAGTPQPVEWQADYGKALAATRAGDQPLLVVLDEPQAADARIEPALLGEGGSTGRQTPSSCTAIASATSTSRRSMAKRSPASSRPGDSRTWRSSTRAGR